MIDRESINRALVAIEGGEATKEQEELIAAFDQAVRARPSYKGPTYNGSPLPEPILRAFIELVRAAGGEIKVSDNIRADPTRYELVVSDQPDSFAQVFRVRRAAKEQGDG